MSKEQDYSKLIAEIIKKKFPFEQAKLKMYHIDDRYYRIPSLIFRLKETDKYNEIKVCIERFSGNLKWTLYRYKYSRKDNYVIGPLILYEIERDYLGNEQINDVKDVLSKDDYQQYCEKAIEDIPLLAKHMQNYFGIDL